MMYAVTAFTGVIIGMLLSYVSRNENKFCRKSKAKPDYEHTKSEEEIRQEKEIAEQWANLLSYSGGEK